MFRAFFKFFLLGETLPYSFFSFAHIFQAFATSLFYHFLEKRVIRIFFTIGIKDVCEQGFYPLHFFI